MTQDKEGGYIEGCQRCSQECHYRCCDQSQPGDIDYSPENGILLYPGEWEKAQGLFRQHLLITLADHHGGKIVACDRDSFDQSRCHPSRNFKPLDCQSYPFFPVMTEAGEIDLAVDTARCPLTRNLVGLKAHYEETLRRWRELAQNNEEVQAWIAAIHLPGYQLYRSLISAQV